MSLDSGSRRLAEDRSPGDGLTTSRVEAFSDAVFAIAITIWSPISAVAIDGAIMISFLLSDGWLERRIGVLNRAAPGRLK